jgi:hypothetical protein
VSNNNQSKILQTCSNSPAPLRTLRPRNSEKETDPGCGKIFNYGFDTSILLLLEQQRRREPVGTDSGIAVVQASFVLAKSHPRKIVSSQIRIKDSPLDLVTDASGQ